MRTIAVNQALLRATSAGLALALFVSPAEAQVRPGAADRAAVLNAQNAANPPVNNAAAAAAANPAATPAAAPTAPQHLIQHVTVSGTQRVEPDTVLTYVSVREGDPYDPQQNDAAVKALYATGLFSDVKTSFDPATSTLNIRVVENPIINQVVFEGNSKVSDKDLTKEVQLKARAIFTRAKVQADVQRIIEVYRRNGKFAARVDPQIIQRPQNRIDLIFSIKEGATTGIARINFVGNRIYDDSTLKGQIATEESAWWKFLSSNDNYDPDRLEFDKEQLRHFYTTHGYADFKTLSAVAHLSPDRESFYVTFTVDEGIKYKFGTIQVNSKIKELAPGSLRPLIRANTGDVYNSDLVQKAIDALTNAAGTQGYAFAEVHPRITRDQKTHSINLVFDIEQGPRVYIEKLNIIGNTRTLDKVIRREFRLQEGDAFNQVLVDRSRTRIRALGFFSDVTVSKAPGSQPDRTNVTVAVTEQSTGSVQLGLGYSSASQLLGEFSYTELNMFGRGQNLKASVQISQISKNYTFSYTEPYFLDRPLSAGFDVYKAQTDYQQATYRSDTTGISLRLGFPVTEYSVVGLHYTYQTSNISPFSNAPLEIQLAAGNSFGSIIGYSYNYNNLDDVRRPTTGYNFTFSQDFAGLGGNLRWVRETVQFSHYQPFLDDMFVGSLLMDAGIISSYDGTAVPINYRFFRGADSFRGFAQAGVGPRDTVQPINTGAVGGDVYMTGTLAVRLPSVLPESYGIETGVFTDFGTVGKIDNVIRACTQVSCIKDNLAFRGSVGVSVAWKSPFGPIQIDLAVPYAKASYDRPQVIHFGASTGF